MTSLLQFKPLASLILPLLLVASLLPPRAQADEFKLKVGQPAPTFSLPNQNGKTVSLSQYQGKWLVLYFYPKDFTSGCTTEAKHFRTAVPTIEKMGVTVIGISEDSVKSHAKFAKTYDLNYTLLADDDGKAASAYDSLYDFFGVMKVAKRHTFIIDPKGRIAAIYTDVDPSKNPQQIIDKLKTLLSSNS